MTLEDFPPWFLRAVVVVFGLLWGSFLNVVIHRVPRGESVVSPPSHCPACGQPIRAWMNVPLLSYVLLGGKAACCGVKVSPRYPLVEAIGGLTAYAILELVVQRLPAPVTLSEAGATFVVHFAVCLGLVAAAFIDLEHMILPDSITYGGAAVGVLSFALRGMQLWEVVLGAAVGFAAIYVPFIVLYRAVRGVPGMGLGDAKLLMLAGAWLGWDGALIVLGAAAVQGTVITLVVLALVGRIEEPEAVKREREELRAELEAMTPEERAELEKELAEDPLADEPEEGLGRARIPFGPFIALATLELLVFGRDLVDAYVDWVPG
jgi:leader peptidase (prepilin peptidase)/N-methyltransferase